MSRIDDIEGEFFFAAGILYFPKKKGVAFDQKRGWILEIDTSFVILSDCEANELYKARPVKYKKTADGVQRPKTTPPRTNQKPPRPSYEDGFSKQERKLKSKG